MKIEAPAQDALTGAGSRAALGPHWQRCVAAALQAGDGCSLLFFDIDHFKSINDAFGHGRGDGVLVEVARRVRDVTRASDSLFRYGGDEFVLVLPGTGGPEAAELAQRVLEAVRRPMGEDGLVIGLSIGVATLPDDGDDARALLERADARNYAAKRQGRARVVTHDAPAAEDIPFTQLSRRVERDAAQARVNEFLAALPARRRGVLTLIGPTGSGRTTMLADVASLARLQGYHVVTLGGLPALRGQAHAALVRALPEFAPAAAAGDPLHALHAALQARLEAAGASRLLVCVDDLPQLDWPTLYLLRGLLVADGLATLGLVVSTDEEGAQAAALLAAPLRAHVHLQAFGEEGLRIWLRLLLQWEPPADFLAWLGEQTDRLPGAVERVLRRLLERGLLQRAATGWQLRDDYTRAAVDGIAPWQPSQARHNLPAQLTSFVGREVEFEDVRRAAHQHRLLTLTGAGGTGKTRLALRVAADLVGGLRHGAWFVDLARVGPPAAVAAAVADALGVRKMRGRPALASVTAWLARKQLLLVLDNCEHLLAACGELVDAVLRAAPNVRILATSREPLGVEGEQAWPVPPLSMPAHDAAEPCSLLRFEAVRLFVERAVLALPGFTLDAGNAEAVAQVCRRLDGIPLAIELAAARLRVLTPAQIAHRLDDRFALLAGGHPAALPRQQTLRALVDWSHDLLSPPEQVLLRRLAVFAGGCTLELAEETCGGLPPLQARAVLPLLGALADKSLLVVVRDGHGGARYQMLESIRHYAQEKLDAAGETAALRDRHLQALLALAERCEPGLHGHQQQPWLERLDAEADDLRAALAWAETRNPDARLRWPARCGATATCAASASSGWTPCCVRCRPAAATPCRRWPPRGPRTWRATSPTSRWPGASRTRPWHSPPTASRRLPKRWRRSCGGRRRWSWRASTKVGATSSAHWPWPAPPATTAWPARRSCSSASKPRCATTSPPLAAG
jgi:diguanylate cyclase (GGDEF)-like protein